MRAPKMAASSERISAHRSDASYSCGQIDANRLVGEDPLNDVNVLSGGSAAGYAADLTR